MTHSRLVTPVLRSLSLASRPPRSRSASPARRTSRPTANWSPSATSATSGPSRPSAASPGPVTMHEAHDINPSSAPTAGGSPSPPTATAATTCSSSRPRRQAATAHLRLGPRHRHRLDARRQERPVRLEPQHRLPVRTGALHRPGRGRARSNGCRSSRAKDGLLPPTGNAVAYVRGPGTWYRKGYRGSSNDDIWLATPTAPTRARLTDFQRPGQLADVVARTARRSTTSAKSTAGRPTSSAQDLNTSASPPTPAAHRGR